MSDNTYAAVVAEHESRLKSMRKNELHEILLGSMIAGRFSRVLAADMHKYDEKILLWKKAYPELTQIFYSAFNDQAQYSDVSIKCRDKIFKVHRVIICNRCKFFQKACEGAFQEAQSKCITMDDDDPECIEVMLYWLYTNRYSTKGSRTSTSDLAFDADMADLADKYDLPELAIAVWEFMTTCITSWDWYVQMEDHVAAVFSSGRDTKSYRQAENMIVEGFVKQQKIGQKDNNTMDWTELFQKNPRFASRIALKLLDTTLKA